MDYKNIHIRGKIIQILFVSVAVFLMFSVNYKISALTLVLRSLSLPLLVLLYWIASANKSKIYLVAMLFASVSNVLFDFNELNILLLGLIAFLIFRILTIIEVIKNLNHLSIVPFVLGTVLFATPITYLFYVTSESLELVFYFGMCNIILNSVLGGISISSYSQTNSKSNLCLLISILLFVILSVLFIIQKFYLYIEIYESLRVLLLLTGHYFYYLYLVYYEKDSK
jgi:hypothetical protein